MKPLELTPAERARILAGDDTALKRVERPDVDEGQQIVLRRREAKRVPVYSEPKFEGHRRKITGWTETPAEDLVWIEVEKVTERLGREYRFHIHIRLRDVRERTRRLGPTPGGPTRPGLKTRERKPKPRGASVQKFTPETERGYGGGKAIDELEAVDDDELERQRKLSAERWERHRQEERQAEVQAEETRRLLDKLGKLSREAANVGVVLDLPGALEKIAREAQGQIVEHRKEAA